MHFALMLNIEASWHATPGDFGGESACSLRVAVCWASAGAGGWGCTSRGLRDEAHPGRRVKSWRLIGSKLGVLGVPKYWGWEGGRREEPYPGEPCNFKVSRNYLGELPECGGHVLPLLALFSGSSSGHLPKVDP